MGAVVSFYGWASEDTAAQLTSIIFTLRVSPYWHSILAFRIGWLSGLDQWSWGTRLCWPSVIAVVYNRVCLSILKLLRITGPFSPFRRSLLSALVWHMTYTTYRSWRLRSGTCFYGYNKPFPRKLVSHNYELTGWSTDFPVALNGKSNRALFPHWC